uniref:sushi, von Willebrand factor type A, EGF and pentraxin domain-containing protein 1-like n=1 Tax=Styela clava TaxID=7725 RepID=UPI00193A2DDD|nr:sushi, von Willebrand factor type A, EGF and pentraxin domain-containing protein 1-like [Styela clava]
MINRYTFLSLFFCLICMPGKSTASCRTIHQFACEDGTCISKARVCDGSPDCSNGEDEFSCGRPLCKQRNWSTVRANGYLCRQRCDPLRIRQCRGFLKHCVCDDECGFSCLNEKTGCSSNLPEIRNSVGHEIIRFKRRVKVTVAPGSFYLYRDMIKYKCRRGMKLIGPLLRCTSRRTWSTKLPRCVAIYNPCQNNRCQNDGICFPRDGDFECVCSRGYSGRLCETEIFNPCHNNRCQNGGTCSPLDDDFECVCSQGYSGRLCETEIKCFNPIPPIRGYLLEEKPFWTPGEAATFRCLDGFELFGEETTVCTGDATWTQGNKGCIRNICQLDQYVLPKGVTVSRYSPISLYLKTFNVGDTVTLECGDGEQIFQNEIPFDPPTIECDYGGLWTPTFDDVFCGALPSQSGCDYPDISISMKLRDLSTEERISYNVGETFQPSCDPGYTLAGPTSIICREDSTWSTLPRCVEMATEELPPVVRCDYPVLKDHMTIGDIEKHLLYLLGDSLIVGCQQGFRIVGRNIITCLANENWSELPRCERLGCQLSLTNLSEGIKVIAPRQTIDSYEVGDILQMSCVNNTKHAFSRSLQKLINSSVCLENESWNPPVDDFKCVQVCGIPSSVERGTMILNSRAKVFYPDETLYPNCPPNHRHSGSNQIKCLEDGSWNEKVSCEPVGCWINSAILDGNVTVRGHAGESLNGVEFAVGHELEIICQIETQVLGPGLQPTITCQGLNVWSSDYRKYACVSGMTCSGKCLSRGEICSCDLSCQSRGDCCPDFFDYCDK